MTITIRPAVRDRDHKRLCELAKQSRYISAFSAPMFSGDAPYEKGWIQVAEEDGVVVGFTCVRHKARSPTTMLYYIMVSKDAEGTGVGYALMRDLEEQTPHPAIELKVEKDNERAIKFYLRLGYVVVDDAYNGRGFLLRKELK